MILIKNENTWILHEKYIFFLPIKKKFILNKKEEDSETKFRWCLALSKHTS